MRLFRLDRAVLKLSPKPSSLLKEYSSNEPQAPHGAFLDLKGRIVATFDQVSLDADTSLLLVESPFVDRLKKHLKQYLFLCDATLEVESYNVYHDLDESYKPDAGEYLIPESEGQIILTQRELHAEVSSDQYTWYRLKHQLPLQGVDYDEELLLNLDEEKYVSFTKGCYLGQEIIARVHFRGKPPRKLVVCAQDECEPSLKDQMTSLSKDPDSGKTWGFVFVPNA